MFCLGRRGRAADTVRASNNERILNEAAWEQLLWGSEASEYERVWAAFETKFRFRPSPSPESWPVIAEPNPSLTSDVSTAMEDLERAEPGFGATLLHGLQDLTAEGEVVYALDWQHPAYRFAPHLEEPPAGVFDWPVPALPNGDYYIFVSLDLSWGVFGHPWEQTWCVFGAPMVSRVRPPADFDTPLIRRNGVPVR